MLCYNGCNNMTGKCLNTTEERKKCCWKGGTSRPSVMGGRGPRVEKRLQHLERKQQHELNIRAMKVNTAVGSVLPECEMQRERDLWRDTLKTKRKN